MRRALFVLLAMSGCARVPAGTPCLADAARAEPGTTYRWRFDPAPHFVTPMPSPLESTRPHDRLFAVVGKWRIERDDSAPSAPFVLRQDRAYGDRETPRVLVERLSFDGVRARVKCRIEGGVAHATCGLMLRAKDAGTYLVARLDALDAKVHLARVVDADATEIASSNAPISVGTWHTLEVFSYGYDVFVRVDSELAFSAQVDGDPRGAIGLWSRGDARVSFDDLEATALGGTSS